MKDEHWVYVVLAAGMLFGAISSWMGTTSTLNDMWETKAIEVGAAHYDAKTGEFAWNEQDDGE